MTTRRLALPSSSCTPEYCQFLRWVQASREKIWLGDRTKLNLRFHNPCWYELTKGDLKGLNVTLPLHRCGTQGERKILYCPFCSMEIGVMERVAFSRSRGSQIEASGSVEEFVS